MLVQGHSMVGNPLEEGPYSQTTKLNELDPSLLNSQEFINKGDDINLPHANPL